MESLWEAPERMVRRLLRWDPFREMMPMFPLAEPELRFMPDFDVKETKDSFQLKADLPGISEKDLEVSVVDNRLTISGKREEEKEETGETYYCCERSCGSFTRTFTLPAGADGEHIRADMANGVLSLVIPKMPESQPKKIAIGAGAKGKA
jgi:HSP20 family protein